MCQLAICMSYFAKCLFKSFPILIGLFVSLLLSCMNCLYVLEIKPLSVASFTPPEFTAARTCHPSVGTGTTNHMAEPEVIGMGGGTPSFPRVGQ